MYRFDTAQVHYARGGDGKGLMRLVDSKVGHFIAEVISARRYAVGFGMNYQAVVDHALI